MKIKLLSLLFYFIVQFSFAQSFNQVQESAQRGEAEAQMILGSMYYSGNETIVNYSKAFYWFQKSAEQGEKNAQFFLGYMYELGEGTPKDAEKAFYWYKISAEQGQSDAQNVLAGMYFLGGDLDLAYHWWKKSAAQGNEIAQSKVDILKPKLEPTESSSDKLQTWGEVMEEKNKEEALRAQEKKDENIEIKKEYYDNGNIELITRYKDGKQHGEKLQYYENGQLWAVSHWKDGKYEGEYKSYYENGNLKWVENRIGGERDGVCIYYHKNGKLWAKGNFINGKYEGYWIRYYDNGSIREEGSYKTNNKQGEWKYYNEQGQLVKTEVYENGTLLKELKNDPTKKQLTNQNFVGYWVPTKSVFYINGEIDDVEKVEQNENCIEYIAFKSQNILETQMYTRDCEPDRIDKGFYNYDGNYLTIKEENNTEIWKGQIINFTANSFQMEIINESEGDEEKVIVYFERYIK